MKELTKSTEHQETNTPPENADLINDKTAQAEVTPLEAKPAKHTEITEESIQSEEVMTETSTSSSDQENINHPAEESAAIPEPQDADQNMKDGKPTEFKESKKPEEPDILTDKPEEKIVVAAMPVNHDKATEKAATVPPQEPATAETVYDHDSTSENLPEPISPLTAETTDEQATEADQTVDELMNDPSEQGPSSEHTATIAEDHKAESLPRSQRLLDILLSIVLLGLSGFFMYRLYTISILSFDWIWKIALLIVLIQIVLFLTIFLSRFPKWAMWLRRIFVILLCIVFTYAGITINTLQNSLEDITQPETATTVNVSLITMKEGGAKKLSDLNGKKIGIQNANDAANSSYVREQLDKEKELKQVEYVEGLDYERLYRQLVNNEIDALIITDYYFKTLLKEYYPTIENDIFILKSYQKEREIDISSSTKDIRYEPFTVYVAGVDEGDDPSVDARSDVNIVLIVNPLANHIEMVSIPRDSFVPNPALYGNNDKLTHLGLNGVRNSMKGIEEVLGFEIDYYVKLNFFSVIDIVDAIGKIEVDVPISFCEQDENRSFAKEDLICLNKGIQRVNGKQALAFARHRKSYSDVMRGKAQQEVIKGIINELTTPNGVANINNVLRIASKTISTNMPMEQVTNFVSSQIDHLKPWTIDSIILENGADARLVTASMPTQELYVMLLNRFDIQTVYETYQSMLNQMQFSSFTFHLDHLAQESHVLPDHSGVVWAGSDVSAYQLNQPEEDVPQESEPEVSEPDDEEPEETPEAPDPTLPPENDPEPIQPDPKPEEPTPTEPTDPTEPDQSTTTTP